MTEDLPADVAAAVATLRREGKYRDAADVCVRQGAFVRAADLFAESWDYAAAIDLARRGRRLDLAYRHALAGEERATARELLSELADFPEQARSAASYAEAKGRLADAARLMESAADIDAAAALFERAGELFEAARCTEAQGRYRDAGLLYERRVREAPDDGEAALRLGRILAHFGRHEHAIRALQAAAEDAERRDAATRLAIACFSALGLDDAAATHLDTLRRETPTLPVTVPEYLLAEFGDERGIAAFAEGGARSETLLAGRYRIVRPLGAGATGRVLLAHDGFYDREVAVKVLTVGGGAAGRDAYVRFAREARVAAGLDHPNVVRVFEFNADGPFLVMEYLPGGTLEDRIAGGEGRVLSLPVIRHVMNSILAGLEAVHRRGVVHRDLKPANVFFGATGDVKIGDFGVAHLTDLGTTLTGAMLGTLAYMAPEQITGASRPDASTDLYALGVILHRMLTGELPFSGPDFMAQHLNDVPPPPSRVAPGLGSAFDALVARLLSKDASARPRTAAEVAALLESLPFDEPDESALELAIGAHAEGSEAARESVPPDVEERYVVLDPLPGGGARVRDALLERVVRVEPCDAARADRLRALGRADSPHLQAVFDVDETEGRAILEEPRGRPLGDPAVGAQQRADALMEVRRAVEHMHTLGIAHGAIDASRIRVAMGRAVLLLPPGVASPDPATDLAALAVLASVRD